MDWIGWFAIAVGGVPLAQAWRANRRTSLRDAILWAAAALFSWGFALARPDVDDLGYLALCLTGCAGVAVLGARRPHVFAWNFVVLGLLCVMILPVLEGMVIQVHSFNIERKIFLAGILIVGIGNYVPTRFAPTAIAVGIASSIAYLRITSPSVLGTADVNLVAICSLAVAPWLAMWSAAKSERDDFDSDWLAFRDRFGFVWGSRVKEQFNAAAKNADLPFHLRWQGLESSGQIDAVTCRQEARRILKALTKRFMEEGKSDATPSE